MEPQPDVLSHQFPERAPLLKGPLLDLAHQVIREIEGRFHRASRLATLLTGQLESWFAWRCITQGAGCSAVAESLNPFSAP
ncbi:MAG: hypothetical protein WBN89_11080 [Prochlorococcaceae cyanobacterium]